MKIEDMKILARDSGYLLIPKQELLELCKNRPELTIAINGYRDPEKGWSYVDTILEENCSFLDWFTNEFVNHLLGKITFYDFEKRYQNIREQNPKWKKCSVRGCKNPRDSTPESGEDTCCAYHRLLFEFWSGDVMVNTKFHHYMESQKGRRRAFTNWRNKIGKEECDRIVLRMAQEGINWIC